mmetsp:Transcript_5017/g.15825  ORF Transcript_5017/g.15825 Transcript_5017/m.15825 type:complete len:81 (+) Transcript_5017:1372-1614(+)
MEPASMHDLKAARRFRSQMARQVFRARKQCNKYRRGRLSSFWMRRGEEAGGRVCCCLFDEGAQGMSPSEEWRARVEKAEY